MAFGKEGNRRKVTQMTSSIVDWNDFGKDNKSYKRQKALEKSRA